MLKLPRAVWLLGWVSLATDAASEAIYPLLPFFLTRVLSAGAISIGIVGTDPFGDEIDKALKNKTVKDRSFSIHRFRETGDIRQCHILFVPRSEKSRLHEILKQVEPWPVLTVGEDEGFARAGIVVNILIEKEKPRLEVNAEAAEKAKLTINSKLLKLATIVRTAK